MFYTDLICRLMLSWLLGFVVILESLTWLACRKASIFNSIANVSILKWGWISVFYSRMILSNNRRPTTIADSCIVHISAANAFFAA